MRRRDLTASLALWLSVVGCAAPGIQVPEPAGSLGFDVASLPVCSDSLPFTGDTTGRGYRPPRPLRLVVPVVNWGRMRGKTVTVRHLVTTNGQVDSVMVEGVTEPHDLAPFEKAAQQMRYVPAQLSGCWRRGWNSVVMTFP